MYEKNAYYRQKEPPAAPSHGVFSKLILLNRVLKIGIFKKTSFPSLQLGFSLFYPGAKDGIFSFCLRFYLDKKIIWSVVSN